jgi:hypothetical protein
MPKKNIFVFSAGRSKEESLIPQLQFGLGVISQVAYPYLKKIYSNKILIQREHVKFHLTIRF